MILKLWVNQVRITLTLIHGIPESCRIYSIQSDIISNDTSKQFISVQEDDPELRALIRFLGKNALSIDENQESFFFLDTRKILFKFQKPNKTVDLTMLPQTIFITIWLDTFMMI